MRCTSSGKLQRNQKKLASLVDVTRSQLTKESLGEQKANINKEEKTIAEDPR
jgi:hypothetical protein